MSEETPLHPYASADYAAAFAPLEPVWLPRARTHVLLRPIPGTPRVDAMGCYPMCVLASPDDLGEDLRLLADRGAVSLVLVTDCLTQPPESALRRTFERCRPYKQHHLHDARKPDADYSKHHRDRIRRARKSCTTEVIALADHLDAWMECYGTLVSKRGITGIQAFPRSYFERVARMRGVTTVGAFVEGAMVSAHIWIRHEGHVYAHLAASNEVGYKLRCSFPVYDHAIQLFRGECMLDFGAGAGAEASENDGLAAFKSGFANDRRTNFLCGTVLDADGYRGLCAERSVDPDAAFFPAYRSVPA